MKAASDLYPSPVKERIEADYKERLWDPEHKRAFANAIRDLQEYESKTGKRKHWAEP